MKKGRRIRGVIVSNYEELAERLRAHTYSVSIFGDAIESAKKSADGYSWASSGGILITVQLDESKKHLLYAELYVRQYVYNG